MTQPDDPEDLDPGLARERTRLAWIRTAISFAAVGVAVTKVNVAAGVTVLVMAPVIWQAGYRVTGQVPTEGARARQLLMTAVAVTVVALVVLVVVLLSHHTSPGFHPPAHVRGV